jgi:hypothetical protein
MFREIMISENLKINPDGKQFDNFDEKHLVLSKALIAPVQNKN